MNRTDRERAVPSTFDAKPDFVKTVGDRAALPRISRQVVDLYLAVVRSKTEWPTRDFSIKTLATFLGFERREVSPGRRGDPTIMARIIEYSEDDCGATRVPLDGIRTLE